MSFSSLVLVALPFVLLLLTVLRALTSPFRSIPGAHWSSRFSHLHILYTRYRSRGNKLLLAAHRAHGALVLLSPTEISVNDLSGLRTVYVGGWEKPGWYSVFTNYEGTPNMFTMLDGRAHSARKRVVSGVYAKSNLLGSAGMEAVREDVVQGKFLGVLEGMAETGQGARVGNLLERMAMDAMSVFIFGRGGGTEFLGNEAGWEELLGKFKQRGKWTFLPQELPEWEAWLGWAARRSRAGRASVDGWCRQLCEKAEGRAKDGQIPKGQAEVWRALIDGVGKEGRDADEERKLVASEVLDHLLAGHETTSIALTFALYHLSEQQEVQRALREEIVNARLKSVPAPLKALDSMPLLAAIVTETLRLDSPLPGPQPRIASEGAFLNGCGPFAKGTRVSSNAYCLHRNEDVYTRADDWIPSRWLEGGSPDASSKEDDGGARLKDMQRWFWAFGSGGRMCVGSNFALLNMKLTLATIYEKFETHIVDASGIDQMDGYTVGPTEELILQFKKM